MNCPCRAGARYYSRASPRRDTSRCPRITCSTSTSSARRAPLLLTFLGVGLLGGFLFWIGLVGWVLRVVSLVVRVGVRAGFLVWRLLLSWAVWPVLLGLVVVVLAVGIWGERAVPGLAIGLRGGPAPDRRRDLPGLRLHRPRALRGGARVQGHPRPPPGAGAGGQPRPLRRAGRPAAAGERGGRRRRRLRPAQPGAVRDGRPGLVSARRERRRSRLHRLPRLHRHEPPRRGGPPAPRQHVQVPPRQLRPAGQVARRDPPDAVQELLHGRPAPADLRVGAARQAALRDHRRLLESAPAHPGAGAGFAAAVRPRRRPAAAAVAPAGGRPDGRAARIPPAHHRRGRAGGHPGAVAAPGATRRRTCAAWRSRRWAGCTPSRSCRAWRGSRPTPPSGCARRWRRRWGRWPAPTASGRGGGGRSAGRCAPPAAG